MENRISSAVTMVRSHFTALRATLIQHKELVWKAVFLVQLCAVAYITFKLSKNLTGNGESYTEFSNAYCEDNSARGYQDVVLDGRLDAACAYDYNFKKVLYFWCDGISWDSAGPIFDNFPSNTSNVFKVRHDENPWSAWVFATFMTGKAVRNMGKVSNDNLMYQFWRTGMKAYLGAENNLAYVFNQLVLDYVKGDGIEFLPGVTMDEHRMFNWFFACSQFDQTEKCVRLILNQAKSDDRSMFLESFILDHGVHNGGNKHSSVVVSLRDQLAEDLAHVKKWVDENPEYLLVLVSDHGQRDIANEPLIHGDWLQHGNEGWVMFYNPSVNQIVSTESDPIVLHTVDVVPTMWQFFSANGVSIPAESVGKAYPVTYSAEVKYKMLLTNALQLRAFLDKEGYFNDEGEHWFKSAKKQHDEGKFDLAATHMEEYVSYLSESFIEEGQRLPMKIPALLSLVSLVTLVCLQFNSLGALWSAARSVGFGLLATPYLGWIVMILFFAQPSDFVNRNQVYAYFFPVFAFLASYIHRNVMKVPPPAPMKKGHRLLSMEISDSILMSTFGKEDSTDQLLSAGIDVPNSTTPTDSDENPIFYFKIWDHARQKRVWKAVSSFIGYILGANEPTPRSPMDYWLMYSLVLFAVFACFEIALQLKRFIVDDIKNLPQYPIFANSISLIVLFLEFRWQRILLTSNLQRESSSLPGLLKQLIGSAYWPLNIKMVVYFAMLGSTFGTPTFESACVIYILCFAHIFVLLFSPTYFQRDLYLPVFVLLFFIGTGQERILICMYASLLHVFSSLFEKPDPSHRHVLPIVLLAMISLSHYYFSVLYDMTYKLDTLNIDVPGIENVTAYPVFSTFMMGVHYLSAFLLLVAFLVRLTVPSLPPVRPFRFGCISFGHVALPQSSKETAQMTYARQYTMTFLLFSTSFAIFMYYVFSISEREDTPMIWAFTIATVAIGYGLTVVCNELTDGVYRGLNWVIDYIARRLQSPQL